MENKQQTTEERLDRIEKHLNKKHWLDEDSGYTLDLNNPWPVRIFLIFITLMVFCVAAMIYIKVTA